MTSREPDEVAAEVIAEVIDTALDDDETPEPADVADDALHALSDAGLIVVDRATVLRALGVTIPFKCPAAAGARYALRRQAEA